MKALRTLSVTLMPGLLCLGAARFSQADPLDNKQIPADARWVIHVDMDAARDTKLWAAVNDQLSNNDDFQQTVHQIEQVTNAQFPRDLHDVTLYGRSAEEEAGVVIVHAHVDRSQVMGLLKMNPDFGSRTIEDHEVLTWTDKGKKMHGSFYNDDTMIIGRTEEVVRDAVEVMDGKAESIKDPSPLAAGAKPQLLAFVAATELSTLKKHDAPQSPMVQQVQNAWISLAETDGQAVVKADIQADSADTAMQLSNVINGARGFVGLAANSKGGDAQGREKAAAMSSLLKTLKVEVEDKTLRVDWRVAIDKGETALAMLMGKPAGNKP